ncbi:flagellar basal body rod modification protein [Frigidibacter albus]|uniref:Basal-body rod modification protein FlgD n=1 Tax=Frigidibacter albus TaxID=1465486 RepID=A0A6L8VL44_9RHOB|nr:flagellar hook capping FlgD N-terminal domain-containing protein [Frigidibacter albus]MZQ90292.1 flagellar basal body rod modification protein [Frigidibacter albus]NBE32210.1 flagellar basal body rod modification protein [Frigidibacter albus]GGH58595.1 basal-body rod modification protein FlgD [Frigidibacter albus]
MTITATAAPQTAAPTAAAASSSAAIKGDYETFLLMLTTQMQNQDPLNPMESSDLAVQLATFSGVEQQVQTNDLLQGLIGQVGLMNMSDLAGWVGMEARAEAPAWFDGAPLPLTLAPRAGADAAVLSVYDAAGRLVAEEPVPLNAGEIDWVGTDAAGAPLPEGAYSFRLISSTGGETMGIDPVETYGKIVEARSEAGAVMLVLEGGVEVAADAVTALRTPE